MNDEIKEIEHIMICLKEHIALSDDEDTYLLDYITNLEDTLIDKNECIDLLETQLTNLQQELEEEKRIEEADLKTIQRLEEENETRQYDINNLTYQLAKEKEENERLKETNVYCNRSDCIGRIKDSKKYDSVYQEKEDYKSRLEKAIEYIRSNEWAKDYEISNCRTHLLNILQNGSEEK